MKKVTFLLLILLLLLPVSAFALSVEVVPDTVKVETEDILQVEVDFRENNIGAIYASFTYDPELLEYIEGDGSAASEGQGSIVLYASSASANRLQTVLKFRAKAMGTAEIGVAVKEALSFEEQPLSTPSASVEITTVRPADAYVIVEANGKRMQALCTPPYLPAGYAETTIDIAGKDITAAVSGENTFVFLTEPDSENGSYYLRRNGEYLPAISLKKERVLLPMPQSEIPQGFSPALLTIDGIPYEGCSDGTRTLVYTLSLDGSPAFYLYDETDQSLQKYHYDVLQLTNHIEVPAEHNYTRPIVLGVIFGLLLLSILVVAIIKRHH